MGANSHTNYALRKNGQQEITPIHPELAEPLEEILGQTYGLIVYQEQVMAIAQKVAGYSLGKADLLRRAMGKKKKSVLDAEYVGFEAGMKANGFSAAAVKTLWDILVPFADYAFNKAHSAGLRADLLLDGVPQGQLPGRVHGRPAHQRPGRQGPPADLPGRVPPDGHQGAAARRQRVVLGLHRRRHRHPLRHGLGAQRRAQRRRLDRPGPRGEGRRSRTSPTSCSKIDTVACNKKVIESLAKAGAFDSLGHSRQGIAAVHAQAVDSAMALKRKEAEGQFDLFGSFGDGAAGRTTRSAGRWTSSIPTADWSKSERLVFERDMLGLYVSDHPLHGVEHVLTSHADTPIAEIIAGGVEDGANVTIAGILTVGLAAHQQAGRALGDRRRSRTSSPASRCCSSRRPGRRSSEKIVRDQIVVVKGRISRRDDQPVAVRAPRSTIPELTEGPRGPVLVSMPAARCTPPVVERLREVLGSHPGTTEVQLKLVNGSRETVLRLDQGLRVRPSTALMGDIKALLGPTSVALL